MEVETVKTESEIYELPRTELVLVGDQPVGWLGVSLSDAVVERLANLRGRTPEEPSVPVRLTYADGVIVEKRVHSNFLARPWR